MRVVFNINGQDVLSFNRFVIMRRPRQVLGFLYMLLLPALVTFGVAGNYLKQSTGQALTYSLVVLVVSLLLGWVWYTRNLLKRAATVKGVLGEHIVVISEDGLRETTAGYDLLRPWHRIVQILEDRNYIYVFLDSIHASQIPKRAFRDQSQAREFVEKSGAFLKGIREGTIPRAEEVTWDADLRQDLPPRDSKENK